jgi:hypothetical protein
VRGDARAGVPTVPLASLVAGLLAFEVALLDPGHEAAEAGAGFLDGVLLAFFEELVEGLVTGFGFFDPLFGKFAVLDFLQCGFHALLDAGVNDLGSDFDVAPFGGFGDGETHAGDAGFVHEVHDELELMEALEVGHLRGVAGLDQHFEACLDEGAGATAKDGLLAEEVGFGFFLEVGLDDAATGATDAVCPGEGDLLGLFGRVLIDGDEAGNAFAFSVLTADDVAGAFRGDHDDVDVCWRHDGLVMDGEAVAEEEGLALGEVRLDVGLVNATDFGVGNGDEDDVAQLHGFGGVIDFEAFFFGDFAALAAGIQTDDDIGAAFLEVKGVCMALGAKADDGAGFAFQRGQAGVFFSVDFCGH